MSILLLRTLSRHLGEMICSVLRRFKKKKKDKVKAIFQVFISLNINLSIMATTHYLFPAKHYATSSMSQQPSAANTSFPTLSVDEIGSWRSYFFAQGYRLTEPVYV